jgi:transporter family-2 protein
MAQVVEPGIGPLDLARERFSLLCRRRAPVAAHEQQKSEISFKLGDRATDVRLTDPERRSGFRHAAMPQHRAKQVEMGQVHAVTAWNLKDPAFDSMASGDVNAHALTPLRRVYTHRKGRKPMLNLLIPASLAIMAGISIVVQQALNANLRVALNSAAWSGFMSYAVGVVCMALLALALRDPVPLANVAARIPWWAWSGGLFGAIFIGLAIFVAPQLGAATFIALLVTGQMLASVTFDHFGWMDLAQRSIDPPRLLGVTLLIGGVVLIQR